MSIREDQREIDRIFPETQNLEKPHTPSVEQQQAVSTPTTNASENSGKGEGWKLLTTGMKRKTPASRNCLQLQNKVTVLKVKEKSDVLQAKNLVHLNTNYLRLRGRNGESPGWVNIFCRGWRHSSWLLTQPIIW